MRKLILAVALVWPLGAGAALSDASHVQELCIGTTPRGTSANVAKYSRCGACRTGLSDSAATHSTGGHQDKNGPWVKRVSRPTAHPSEERALRERRAPGAGSEANAKDVRVGVSAVQHLPCAAELEG
jgi:phage tail tape-measure protein